MNRTLGPGETSAMPYSVYIDKIQTYPYFDNPNTYETYMRKELADFRTEAPSLESDMPRSCDDYGYGTHSREMLNLRHAGARSTEDPYLPDGTFLDQEFLEKDPRGTTGLPNMQEARRQKTARASLIKFYDDADNSLPESGINPAEMSRRIRNSRQDFKNRWQNFDESMDNMATKATVPGMRSSATVLCTTDGTILNIAEASARNRQDAVSRISNDIPGVFRLNTPDHRVKISKYGMQRANMKMTDLNWTQNRSAGNLDHKTFELNGERANKQLAMMIVDLEGQRANKQLAAMGANYSESEVQQIKAARRQLNPEDVQKILNMGITSQPTYDMTQEGMQRTHMQKSGLDHRHTLQQSILDVNMAASMVQVNKKLDPQKSTLIRNDVQQSAAQQKQFATMQNRQSTIRVSDRLARESFATPLLEDSKQCKIYSNIAPQQHTNIQLAEFERLKHSSKQLAPGFKRFDMANISNDVESLVKMREFATGRSPVKLDSTYKSRGYSMDVGDIEHSSELDSFL